MGLQNRVEVTPGNIVVAATAFTSVGISSSVKFLTESDLTLWNQIVFRNIAASVIGLVFISSALTKLRSLPTGSLKILALRCAIYITAIYFFTTSLANTSVANFAFIGSFPFIAVLSVIFYRERIDLKQFGFLLLATVGLVIVSGITPSDLSLGLGEVSAVVASTLFSMAWLLSRNLDKGATAPEYAVMTQVLSTPLVFFVLLAIDGPASFAVGFSLRDLVLSIIAGFFIVMNVILISSGAKRVSGVSLGVLTSLGPVVAVAAAIVLFTDTPSIRELIGGVVVVVAALAYSITQAKEKPEVEV